jgi:hypothetical protein
LFGAQSGVDHQALAAAFDDCRISRTSASQDRKSHIVPTVKGRQK